jgi:hypothetical protein
VEQRSNQSDCGGAGGASSRGGGGSRSGHALHAWQGARPLRRLTHRRPRPSAVLLQLCWPVATPGTPQPCRCEPGGAAPRCSTLGAPPGAARRPGALHPTPDRPPSLASTPSPSQGTGPQPALDTTSAHNMYAPGHSGGASIRRCRPSPPWASCWWQQGAGAAGQGPSFEPATFSTLRHPKTH